MVAPFNSPWGLPARIFYEVLQGGQSRVGVIIGEDIELVTLSGPTGAGRRRLAHHCGRNDQPERIKRHPCAIAIGIGDPVGLQDAIVVSVAVLPVSSLVLTVTTLPSASRVSSNSRSWFWMA